MKMDLLDRLSDFHVLLPSYDQIAPRIYMNACLCFPFDQQHPKQQTYAHLRCVLDRLGEKIPLLTGTLRVGWDGNVRVVLTTSTPARIPMEISWVGGQQFGAADSFNLLESYRRLADSGFPVQAFADKFWDLNDQYKISEGQIPVAFVRCVFIPKGLLLFLHLHHSLTDVTGLKLFAQGFAGVSRGLRINIPRSPVLTLPIDEDVVHMPLEALATDCLEYFVLDKGTEVDTSPVAMEGRTFIFGARRLAQLRNKLHKILGQDTEPPSIYVCLASLTFAHVYRVRVACEQRPVQVDLRDDAKLFTPVDWRPSCCQKEIAKYFGNTTVTQMTGIPQQELHEACTDISLHALARLAAKITDSLASVDQKTVLKRDALIKQVDDPRQIVLDTNPHQPHEFHFDSWRTLGDETKWNIPGVITDRPDAVCRVGGGYSRPGAVILPAIPNSNTYEIQLVLPSPSMQALCADRKWLEWVDRVSRFIENLEGI